MRGECKYAHICGEWKEVKVTECWGEKEPSICDVRRKEYCDRYKPIDEEDNLMDGKIKDTTNTKLSWIKTSYFDELYGSVYKCARCGKGIIGRCNYCPHCGYEYNPWDGVILR